MSAKTPSRATTKRLFAVSGNQCAFPQCKLPLVDQDSGKVTGRICHIKGNRLNSKRYDPEQTDEERHGFDNLLLMCPIHHDVIDDDEVSYTVERLLEIKHEHESADSRVDEPSEDVAEQLIVDVRDNTMVEGSIINSVNQMGGQVAHSITNVGPQPRRISRPAGDVLITELRRLSPEQFDISCMMGNSESEDLAAVLKHLLTEGGWSVAMEMSSMYNATPRDVIASIRKSSLAIATLVSWMNHVGLRASY